MKPNIGLSPKNLAPVKDVLNSILADAVVLYTKTRKFHWNVSGNSFMELHKLFEDHYKKMEESIDEIAVFLFFLPVIRFTIISAAIKLNVMPFPPKPRAK